MAREFEKRDKKVVRMTRDGLVEKNLATGEETRATQHGQEFNLRDGAPPGHQPGAPPAREAQATRHRQPTPQSAESLAPDTGQPVQGAGFRQDGDSPGSVEAPGHSPESAGASGDVPADGRHHDPPGFTPETPNRQHKAAQRRFAEDGSHSEQPAFSAPDQPMEAARPVERDIGARAFETPAGGDSVPSAGSAPPSSSAIPDLPGRLRYAEGADTSEPSGKPKQRGTTYHQKFVGNAAKSESGAKPADAPKASAPEAGRHDQPSRLRFSKDERLPDGKVGASPLGALSPDKKLQRAQYKSKRVGEKLDAARKNIPTKKRLKRARVYDEQKNKVKSKLEFEKVPLAPGEKRFKPPAVVAAPLAVAKGTGKSAATGVYGQFHRKIYQVEHENVGIQAAHKAELVGEAGLRGGARATRSAYRFAKNTPYRTVEKLEKQAMKANVKLSYRKALSENPQLKSNVVSRFIQKQKIKRQYAKAFRDAKKAGEAAKKTGSVVGNAAKAVAGFVKRHPVVAGIVALLLFVVFFLSSILSSCSNMATGMLSGVVGSSYVAEDRDIDDAELGYTDWETELQMQVNSAERDHPGYDEYRYNVDDIGHDPFELMAYLTAMYQDFKYADVEVALRAIFAEQYQLTFTPTVETRYRTETRTDPDTGEIYDVEVPYDWHVMTVTLTACSFSEVIAPKLDADQRERFELYMRTKGNRQYIVNPFAFNWLPQVTSYYGWRIHPISGAKDFHTGIDIGVPIGTDILAGMDGTVSYVGYDAGGYGNYVVIENDKGLQAKFAHCDSILVSVGQQVKKTDIIAKSGNTGNSTGPHLHLEVLKDGQYLNPLYFAETGDDGSGRLPPGSPGGILFPENPGLAMGDGTYDALIAAAEQHLGKPYVFGAKGPNAFDCSGFVCAALTQSGIKSIATNAQGIYNACTPVSLENAKPGDLLFFTKTYSTSNPVTHVAIYCGGNVMLHAGKPVQYTTFDTRYWKDHFYAAGRVN